MKTCIKTLRSKKGFTLVEVILVIMMGAMISGSVAAIMMNQTESYEFIATRKQHMMNIRQAVNLLSNELRKLDDGDVTAISKTRLDFVDEMGANTYVKLDSAGSGLAVYYGNQVLIDNIKDFEITYMDGAGNVLDPVYAAPNDVKRFSLNVTTNEKSNEGEINFNTTVIPRSLVGYSNYQ